MIKKYMAGLDTLALSLTACGTSGFNKQVVSN